MNIAVGMDDVYEGELVTVSEAGPAPKRIVVSYGFWIFLLSDIVMFSALFASYAVLAKATAGGPTGAHLFNQQNVAMETAFLLLSSYSCGLMSLATNSRHYFRHLLGRRGYIPPGSGISQPRATRIQQHDCDGSNSATQRVSFRLLYAGRLSWAACDSRTDLAGSHDDSARNVGIPPRCRAPHALLLPVLARAGHHLGPDIHDCLSDGSRSMTETRWDVAPGDRPTIPGSEQVTSSGFLVYTIGLLLAVILTLTSFWVANTSVLWTPGVPAGLVVLAIAQMGVHLVFFLHITTGPDNTNNILALAFGVLIVFLVLVGSLVIMANLNENMTAHTEVMNLHMQH